MNTRSDGRVKKYTVTAASAHSRGSPHGPTGALNTAAREKISKYANLYPDSIVSGYAIDLVGTPSPYSRRALVDNAIQKEVAFATAKATALAAFRYSRIPAPALPSPQAPLAVDTIPDSTRPYLDTARHLG